MLEKVSLQGNYFTRGGKRFIPVGVNWVPALEAMQWPYEWNPKNVEADFAMLADLGINFIRFDLVWQWFEPRPGQYNEKAFEQFDFMVGLAHQYGTYLNPAFFIGGEVGDAFWDIPWRNGRHPHSDPDLLHFQAMHIEQFGSRYRDESAILAWDLTDEPPFWIVGGSTTDAMAANWTRLLCYSLRNKDPEHLIVCGTAASEIGRSPFRADVIKEWVDFLSCHPYPIYEEFLYKEPLLSTRLTYAAAFETKLSLGVGKPVLMQEFGATSAMYDPQRQARYYNTMMYSALAAGNQGFIAWCATDADPNVQYRRAPYIRCPHETQFGITDYKRTPRPHGLEMRSIRAVVDQMDLDGVEPAHPQAGILVPHEWAHGPDYNQYGFPADSLYQYAPDNILDYHTHGEANVRLMQSYLSTFILCRQAGLLAGFPRELDDWSAYPVLLAPAPATNTNGYPLYVPFWQRVLPWVQAGGCLYASLSAMSPLSIPDVIDLFGASILDRTFWKPEVELTFQEDFHGIHQGESFRFQSPGGMEYTGACLKLAGGRAIATDQEGNPALVAFANGKGKTLLCVYPLEMMLGVTPNAFENQADHWKIFRALKQFAGLHSAYEQENADVELGLLEGQGRDFVVLVNHAPQAVEGQVHTNRHGSVSRLDDSGRVAIPGDGHWTYHLEGYTGAVYENKKG